MQEKQIERERVRVDRAAGGLCPDFVMPGKDKITAEMKRMVELKKEIAETLRRGKTCVYELRYKTLDIIEKIISFERPE